jgi:SpoVK/Ycf46/Vps4 family AAA+-type ATPase
VWDDPLPDQDVDESILPHVPPPIGSPIAPGANTSQSNTNRRVQLPPQPKQAQLPPMPSTTSTASKPTVTIAPRSKSVETSTKSNDAALQAALKTIDTKLKEAILNEIIQDDTGVDWEDVVGLGEAKRTLEESVILPLVRPDLYRGLRTPPRGGTSDTSNIAVNC